jgi:hypothetical protein
MKGLASAAVCTVLGFGAAAGATAAPARGVCTAGVHSFGGVNARTFCGPATATLVVGGRALRFRGGSCERGPQYVAVNIGTVVLGTTTKPKPDYFGLLVGKAPIVGGAPAAHDGTFKAQAVSAHHGAKGYAITSALVTLAGRRTRGTFTGRVFGSNAPVHGTFRC